MYSTLFGRLRFAHVASIAIVVSTFALLSPSVGSLSGVQSVFGYGAGLSVDSTTVLNGFAVADDSYANGFRFVMRVTVDDPTEDNLQLKFADWSKLGGGGSITAGSNMLVNLISTTAGATAAGNAYAGDLAVGADLDVVAPGIQQDVYVYLKVPGSTVGGAYSSTYGVMSHN